MTETTATAKCLRGNIYHNPEGATHILIMDDNTLKGFHECDLYKPTQEAVEMKFFRPSADTSVLACPNCFFRVKFCELPRDNFENRFLEIEKFLDRRMHLFWKEQLSLYDCTLIGSIRLKINEGVVFGERIEAWHCWNEQDVKYVGNSWIKMGFRSFNNKYSVLHCPECGYEVKFEWSQTMTIKEAAESIDRAINRIRKKPDLR